MSPKVSIIVPVYKTKDTLVKCVHSLLEQTLEDIEIILVDDGSPDESGAICDSFLYDNRVKVIHKMNGGLSSARNRGIEAAAGQYIGFVDSDDYVSNEMFEILYNTIQKDSSDVSICAHYTVDETGYVSEHHFINIPEVLDKKQIYEYLLLSLIGEDRRSIHCFAEGFVWRNIYKKELLLKHPFKSEREFFAEDIINDLEVFGQCERISVVDKCLYYYVYNNNSLSNKYRPDVYILLNRLLSFEKDFLNEKCMLSEGLQRLYATGIKFVVFSIINTNKSGLKLSEKRKEVKLILNQPMMKEAVRKVSLRTLRLKTKIFVCLCRLNMFSVLLAAL